MAPSFRRDGSSGREVRREVQELVFYSLNVRGLTDDKLEVLVSAMQARGIFAMTIQETWRRGDFQEENQGFLFLNHGHAGTGHKKGQGVGVLLSPAAREAWRDAGSADPTTGYGGPPGRLMSLRLDVSDGERPRPKTQTIQLASGYAPTTGHADSTAATWRHAVLAWESDCSRQMIPVAGGDLNCALGVRKDGTDKVLGSHGIEHTNARGEAMFSDLAAAEMCAPMSFFRRRIVQPHMFGRVSGKAAKITREALFSTWFHPRSRRGYTQCQWLLRRKDLKRVRVARNVPAIGIATDHRPIMLALRVAVCVRRARQPAGPRMRVDRGLLRQGEVRAHFRAAVLSAIDLAGAGAGTTASARLTAALQQAADAVLSVEDELAPEWFRDSKKAILEAAVRRDVAQAEFDRKQGGWTQRTTLRAARQDVKKVVRDAKAAWLTRIIEGLEVINKPSLLDPCRAWKAITHIKRGISRTRSAAPTAMRKPDGSLCKTDEENAEVFSAHFSKVFNIDREFDPTVLNLVQQRPLRPGLDNVPSTAEVAAALRGLANNSAPGDSKVPSEYMKALVMSDAEVEAATPEELAAAEATTAFLVETVTAFWGGEVPDEWLVGRLKALPKTSKVSEMRDAGKWRGIVLQDVLCKLTSAIIARRLTGVLMDGVGMEEQCGFSPERGTPDGSFTTRIVLKKRREHKKETWALFCDLVKAFDSIDREGMCLILAVFGIPPHLIELIRRLHTDNRVLLKVGKDDTIILNTAGVKQGDVMAPVLFLFCIQACMEALATVWPAGKLKFHTKRQGGQASSMPFRTVGELVEFWVSLYADDGAFFFETRADLVAGTRALGTMFRRFGLQMHSGVGFCTAACDKPCTAHKASKTEALFIPGSGDPYSSGDTSPFEADGGYITFCKQFTYLGSIITWDLDDSVDVTARIAKASSALGSLGCVFKNKDISIATKWTAYMVLVMSILLFGSESWTLRIEDLRRLQTFHHAAVRRICGVTLWHRRRTEDLLRSIGPRAASIDHYVAARQLRWAGHVARMDAERLPRLVMFSWLQSARARGGRYMTWGDRLLRNLSRASLPILAALRGGGHGRSTSALRTALLTNWANYAMDHKGAWRTNVVSVAEGGLGGLVPRPRPKKTKK